MTEKEESSQETETDKISVEQSETEDETIDEKSDETEDSIVKDEKIRDLTETVKRIQAEFENFRKRTEKENRVLLDCAAEGIIRKLIPLLENIRLAEHNINNKDEFIKGAEIIFTQFKDILKAEGLEEIDCLGDKFDPNKHEALLRVTSDKDDQIEEEIQKGYMLNDKVLVHPKVAVGKKDDNKGDEKRGDTKTC